MSNGSFHINLKHREDNILDVFDGVPLCCKLSLRGYEAPLTLNIKNLGKGDFKVYTGFKITEPSSSNNEGTYANVRFNSHKNVV